MKKILLPLFLTICMVALLAPAVSAEEANVVLPTGVTAESFGENTVVTIIDGNAVYYADMTKALAGIHGVDNAILYCKPGADAGTVTHGHVCKNLTVYGNDASVSGNGDFEIDMYECPGIGPAGTGLVGNVTLNVYNLDGCGAWGTRHSSYTVNLVFEGCENMSEVYITGAIGINNISLTDCSFTSNANGGNCKVYSNINGDITLTRVAFSNVDKAVNLNHKMAGTQNIVLDGCTFTDCGNDVSDDQIPVRVLSSVEGGSSMLSVENCSFSGTPEGGADILLDYGKGTTFAAVSETAANLTFMEEENVSTDTVLTTSDSVSFKNFDAVAKIGENEYPTLQAALEEAAKGDNVTIQLLPGTFELGAVEFPATLKGVTIKGADNKATILKNSSFLSSTEPSISYENITIDGIVFDNSYIFFNGWRTSNDVVKYSDWTITNCEFHDVENEAAVFFSLGSTLSGDGDEAMENFTFTNNIIDGVMASEKSGVGITSVEGKVEFSGNVIKNVSWNAIQLLYVPTGSEVTIEDNILESGADEGIVNIYGVVGDLTVDGNTMSQSFANQPFFCWVEDVQKNDGFISGGIFKGTGEAAMAELESCLVDGFQLFTMANGEYGVAETGAKVTVTYDGYHSVTVVAGTVISKFTPDNDGYELVGWYTEPEFVNEFDFSRPIIEDVTLYPCWKTDYHDIDTGYVMVLMKMLKMLDISVEIIEAEGGKIVVVVPEKIKYNKPAVCTVIPDEGYAVADVIVDGESVGAVKEYTIEKLKGKHTVTAVFEKITDNTEGEQ